MHPDLLPHTATLLALPDLVRRVQPSNEETVRRLVKRAFVAPSAAAVDEDEQFLLAQLPSILHHRLRLAVDDPHVLAARALARVVEIQSK